jgi:hypothetical protein
LVNILPFSHNASSQQDNAITNEPFLDSDLFVLDFNHINATCVVGTRPAGLRSQSPRLNNILSKMSLTFDEYGRPFIVIREQAQKQRIRGLQAQKVIAETRK